MKFNKVTILFVLIFSFFQNHLYATDELEVTFFNVGQGNCTLIGCPNGPPLLVDAGTMKLPENENSRTYKKNTINEISEKIKNYFGRKKILNVIISHGDKDHYNWVIEIVNAVKKQENSIQVNILAGGYEKDYTKPEHIKKLNSLQYTFVSEYKNNITEFPMNFGNAKVTCLSTILDKDSNVSSIVLKLSYGNIGVILTGDATETTTDSITTLTKKIDEKVILQASHHGAETHGSNNDKWLGLVKPNYIIMSAGKRLDFRHPKAVILERLIQENIHQYIEKDMPWHSIQFHKELPLFDFHNIVPKSDFLKPYALKKSGYFMALTCLGIYDTGSHGHIKFTWNSTSSNPVINSTSKVTVSSSKNLRKLICSKLRHDQHDRIMALNLNNLEIDNDILNTIPLIREVTSIDLSNNQLILDQILINIIQTINLRELKIENQNPVLNEDDVKRIREIWNSRGLVL